MASPLVGLSALLVTTAAAPLEPFAGLTALPGSSANSSKLFEDIVAMAKADEGTNRRECYGNLIHP